MTAPSGGGGRKGRGGWFWLGLVVALLVVAGLGGRSDDTSVPYDPDGVGRTGAKALRLLLEDLGADVDVRDSITDDTEVVVVLSDSLTDDQRADLGDWVDDGGRLVIADPYSVMTPLVGAFDPLDPGAHALDVTRPGRCDIDALDDVVQLEPVAAVQYEVPRRASSCFGDGEQAFVVAEGHGAGIQVSVGGADVFTNEWLDEQDNAVLAASLMAPEVGTRVVWLERDQGVPGETTSIWALVAPGPRAALWQLAIAAVVYVVVRARRLGRPLQESSPVQLEGSELVVAVGNLMHRGHDPDRAARVLRADLRRSLRDRLGLPGDASDELVAQVLSTRFAIDPVRAQRAVIDGRVTSEEELVALARDIESLRKEVIHGHATQPSG
jgi:hypothetical protein